ncbi:MAG TPA: hypothetical protein PKD55_00085 [Bellilinea sp.]|nr:hypothetical protein [Bellilinea sp.]
MFAYRSRVTRTYKDESELPKIPESSVRYTLRFVRALDVESHVKKILDDKLVTYSVEYVTLYDNGESREGIKVIMLGWEHDRVEVFNTAVRIRTITGLPVVVSETYESAFTV